MSKFSFVAVILCLVSCASQKSMIGDNFLVGLQKGACFGSCPVYTLAIDKTGLAQFDGQRFTDKIGKHQLQLDKSQLQNIAIAFNTADLNSFKSEYKSNTTDLPEINISYKNTDIEKSIVGKDNRPEEVLALQTMLEDIVESDGWISLEPLAEEKEEEEEKVHIEREIIVEFASGTIISRWLRQFKEFEMYVKKPLSDDRKTWIVQYDKSLINPQVMLHKVQSAKGVVSAQFNTKVVGR